MAGLCNLQPAEGPPRPPSLTSAWVSVEGNVDVVLNASPDHGESGCSRDALLSHVTPSPGTSTIAQSSWQLVRHHQEDNACRNSEATGVIT